MTRFLGVPRVGSRGCHIMSACLFSYLSFPFFFFPFCSSLSRLFIYLKFIFVRPLPPPRNLRCRRRRYSNKFFVLFSYVHFSSNLMEVASIKKPWLLVKKKRMKKKKRRKQGCQQLLHACTIACTSVMICDYVGPFLPFLFPSLCPAAMAVRSFVPFAVPLPP